MTGLPASRLQSLQASDQTFRIWANARYLRARPYGACGSIIFRNRMRFKCMLEHSRHGIEHTLIILSPTAYYSLLITYIILGMSLSLFVPQPVP